MELKYKKVYSIISLLLLFASCKQKNPAAEQTQALPDSSYMYQPEEKFDTSDYVINLKHMQAFYDVPGEFGFIAEGKNYGFKNLSFILTNTQPNGGPPLHVHETEEAHVLQEGSVRYIIGDTQINAQGPYIARVPAGVPHTFINTGTLAFHLVAVFPGNFLTYKELGRNPLVKDTSVYHPHMKKQLK